MNRTVFVPIVASVLMSSLAQIVLKSGMSSQTVLQGLTSGFRLSAVASIAANPLVWGGLRLYVAIDAEIFP